MFKSRIVFGDTAQHILEEVMDAVRNAEDENPDEDKYEVGAKELLTWSDSDTLCIEEREFETEAELNAYFQGCTDMDGYLGWSGQLDDEDAEIIEKVIEAKERME